MTIPTMGILAQEDILLVATIITTMATFHVLVLLELGYLA